MTIIKTAIISNGVEKATFVELNLLIIVTYKIIDSSSYKATVKNK